MKDNWSVLRKIQKKIGFLVYTKQAGTSGDIAGILFDYLLGVTLIDVSRVDGILRLIDENMDTVLDAFTYVGRLDALISILSFRESLPSWSEPVFSGREGLNARGLYHPLIKDAVSNDFSLPARAILTGANASGKSTFMKALAINVLLAQTVNTCCCESFSLPVLKVMTSMAIRDDVVSGESYYVREVRYLKRMLDVIDSGKRTLCIIDEILKGTNQKERLAASESVLRYIAERPGFCVIATHDMELVNKLSGFYEPYYFESIIGEDSVSFNYIIRKGLGGGSNALALLKAFGFPKEVLDEADQLIAASFTT
jgi:DNA mismatch repair ATPase MutS